MTPSVSAGRWASFISAAPATADWRRVGRITGLGAVVALYLCLVGIVVTFDQRDLIVGIVSLGDATLIVTYLVTGYLAASYAGSSALRRVLAGVLGGAGVGASLSGLVLLGSVVNLRAVLLQASPELYSLLTLGLGVAGFWVPMAMGAFFGAVGGATRAARPSLQRSLIVGALAVVLLGVFGGLLRLPLASSPFPDFARLLFGPTSGLTVVGAIVTIAGAVGWDLGARLGSRMRARQRRPDRRDPRCRNWRHRARLHRYGHRWNHRGRHDPVRLRGGADRRRHRTAAGRFDRRWRPARTSRATCRRPCLGDARRPPEDRPTERPPCAHFPGCCLRVRATGIRRRVLRPGHGAGRALRPDGPRPEHHPRPGRPARPGLRRLLRGRRVYRWPADRRPASSASPTGPSGPRCRSRSCWRCSSAAFLGLPILGHPRRLPGHRHARIRRDHPACWPARTCSSAVLGGPRGITSTSPSRSRCRRQLPGRAGADLLHRARLRGDRRVHRLSGCVARDLGRAWVAIREDEDVAEALGDQPCPDQAAGVHAGRGLRGAGRRPLRGADRRAIFSSSINLFVSINVAAIIIVGGMGSIPGVVVGAIFLIGTARAVPRVLRVTAPLLRRRPDRR